MKNIIAILFVLFLTLSCDSNVTFNKFTKDFDDNRWPINTSREFEFEITKPGTYNLSIHFGHVYDFQFETVPLEIVITQPNADIEKSIVVLQIKDKHGNDKASCGGDICDLYQDFETNSILKKGIYKVKITNKFQYDYLPNVLGIGIKVVSNEISK